jgi:hypothetical protein
MLEITASCNLQTATLHRLITWGGDAPPDRAETNPVRIPERRVPIPVPTESGFVS